MSSDVTDSSAGSPTNSPGVAPAGPVIYRTGTLKYTMAGLTSMMVWMLWGDFIWRLMESVLPGIMPYLLKDLGASNETIQLLSRSLASAITFTMSPMVSYSSDRHRGKYGRRIPYMLWTTPFVAVALALIGFYKDISHWLVGADGTFFGMPLTMMYIVTFGVLLVAFDVFNVFVNDVYYYLFNDVVPEKFFTRFQAIFGMVGTLAGMVYGAFIFPYMLEKWQWVKGVDNFKLVLICAGIMYGVGFMVMCYMVKEGKYPRPPAEKPRERIGPVEGFLKRLRLAPIGRWFDDFGGKIKTYSNECFTHKFYWYFFLSNVCLWTTYAIGSFVGLRNRDTLGFDMKEIGWVGVLTSAVSFFMLYPAGWIADKFHPVRMYMIFLVLGVLNTCVQCVWIFADFGHYGNLYLYIAISLGTLPISTIRDLVSGPMYMRVLPKSRYGQFCSANGMLRAFIAIGAAWITGRLMDILEKGTWWAHSWFGLPRAGLGTWAYRLWPIWVLFWMGMAIFFFYLLYREWKNRGGAEAFAPPEV